MTRVLFAALVMLLLSGCGINMAVPHTAGAWIWPASGSQFQPHTLEDPNNALLYIYRPANSWGADELQAPGVFIDGDLVFGLKSGAYGWVELPPGKYAFYARRPLGPLFLTSIFDVTLQVKSGERYFFRYSEQQPLNMPQLTTQPDNYVADGPLQQVPTSVGVAQIRYLKQDVKGVVYTPPDDD